MKNNKKMIMIVVLLTIISTTIFISCRVNKNLDNNVSGINKTINDIIQYEIEDYSENKLLQIENEVNDVLLSTSSEVVSSKANFILGTLYVEKNNKQAIEKLNLAIRDFSKIYESKIKIRAYYELSKAYLNEMQYLKSEEAFENMKKEGKSDKEEVIKYYLKRADDLSDKGDDKSKIVDLLEEALELAMEIDYYDLEDIYLYLGRAYANDERLVESNNAKLEALSIVRSKNMQSKIINISMDIGLDYLYSQNYSEAAIFLSRVVTDKLKDEEDAIIIKNKALSNLVDCYIKLKDYDSAKESLDLLKENIDNMYDSEEKEVFLTQYYLNKADLQTENNKPLEAIKSLNLAKIRYNENENIKNDNFEIKLLEEYGDAYYKLEDYENALNYHKKSEKFALDKNISYVEELYNEKIYDDYKALKDYDNMVIYLEKNIELKTNKSKFNSQQYSQYLIKKFENNKNLEKLWDLENSKKKMMILFIVLGGTIVIISGFSYYIYGQNKEINRLNKLFKNLSVTDSLTQIYNRRALDEFLAGNWVLYKKTHMPISFMMIDLDFFKLYNDNYGHPKGDEVLQKVAEAIKKSSRNTDFVARYGGEEFIVIMLNTDKNNSINLANMIRENVDKLNITHEYSKISKKITLSMGITTAYMGTNEDYESYIQKADRALYEAKAKGKDTYVYLN